MIETSGERFVGRLPREVIKIVDVKCPDSGEADTFNSKNLEVVDAKDEIKFVLSTRRDYEFARDFTREHALTARVRQVLFSPAFADPNGKWPGLEPRELVEWITERPFTKELPHPPTYQPWFSLKSMPLARHLRTILPLVGLLALLVPARAMAPMIATAALFRKVCVNLCTCASCLFFRFQFYAVRVACARANRA